MYVSAPLAGALHYYYDDGFLSVRDFDFPIMLTHRKLSCRTQAIFARLQ
nr:MAG TPA: Frataxin [Caudoviricetes sp.]